MKELALEGEEDWKKERWKREQRQFQKMNSAISFKSKITSPHELLNSQISPIFQYFIFRSVAIPLFLLLISSPESRSAQSQKSELHSAQYHAPHHAHHRRDSEG